MNTNLTQIKEIASDVKKMTDDVKKMTSIPETPKIAYIEEKYLGLILNTLIVCSQRGAFKLDEYKNIGELFERLKEKIPKPIAETKTNDDQNPKLESNESNGSNESNKKIFITELDLALSINVIVICSQRSIFKLEEYKAIGELFENFKAELDKIVSK